MSKVYEIENYLICKEEGYCMIKGSNKKIPASEDVINELLRSNWRAEKSKKRYYQKNLSYNNEIEDGIEYIDFIPSSSSYNTEVIAEKNEFYNIMNDAIKNFPARTREVGQLYFFGGHTEKEIAEQLNISHQVVHYQKKLFSRKINENKELVELYEEIYER
ncbi:MAG: sigma-70 family RNA polymerase sigma factor [Lachnospiraceae bacterium]|nr:sigma-70 family RNA polymerase sigma factor [Lachnospiraceae bacterium]